MKFGVEFGGANLVQDVGVAGFVDLKGLVAVRAFNFVNANILGFFFLYWF